MSVSPDHIHRDKAVRLTEYLLRLAFLRTKLVRNVSEYEKVLWIGDIPRQKGCFTQAWGRDEDYDSDVWIEVQNRREPGMPDVPDQCKDWIDKNVLRDKDDLPELLPEITVQIRNPVWQEGSDQPEFVNRTDRLANYPEIQKAWDH